MIEKNKALKDCLRQHVDKEHLEELDDVISNAVKLFEAKEVVIIDRTGRSTTIDSNVLNEIIEGGCYE